MALVEMDGLCGHIVVNLSDQLVPEPGAVSSYPDPMSVPATMPDLTIRAMEYAYQSDPAELSGSLHYAPGGLDGGIFCVSLLTASDAISRTACPGDVTCGACLERMSSGQRCWSCGELIITCGGWFGSQDYYCLSCEIHGRDPVSPGTPQVAGDFPFLRASGLYSFEKFVDHVSGHFPSPA